MRELEKSEPYSICFNVLKIKYADFDSSIMEHHFLSSAQDKVNVFINMESVLKNLSNIPDLERKLIMCRGFEKLLSANFINLAAHYKRFFVGNHIDVQVYLYHTDLKSDLFNQYKYNENFRSYFSVKYTENPKFVYLTDALEETVFPLVKKCCEFINGVHYIKAHNIEGSLVPYLFAKADPSRKNLIIGSDLYDTQYSLLPDFLNHYIKRGFGKSIITANLRPVLTEVISREDCDLLLASHSFYTTWLSLYGDKPRSLDRITAGAKTLEGSLQKAIDTNMLTPEITNPNILAEALDESFREEFLNNYYCTSIPHMYEELTDAEKLSITMQPCSRFDNQGLIDLNNTVFSQYPLTLEALCI